MSATVPVSVIAVQLATMAAAGGLGQLARGLFGLYKLRLSQGDKWTPDWKFFGISLVTGGVIGVVCGLLLNTDNAQLLMLAGYAGVDAIEGLLSKRIEAQGVNKG